MRPQNILFVPKNYNPLLAKSCAPRPLIGQPSPTVSENTTGNVTPMPQSPLSSSPAWDPNSHLPELELKQSPAAGPSHLPVSLPSEHILLDPRLLDAQLRVIVGGLYKNKEMVVTISLVNGQPSILTCFYTKRGNKVSKYPLNRLTMHSEEIIEDRLQLSQLNV